MENKYYVPKIEEFHVGFEYEIRCEIGKNDWSKCIFNDVFLPLYYTKEFPSIDSELRNNNIRVKYLDASDIESFGFSVDGHTKTLFPIYRKRDHTIFRDSSGAIVIAIDDKIRTPDSNGCKKYPLFKGFIKNKSELKKVLQMIGVLEDDNI